MTWQADYLQAYRQHPSTWRQQLPEALTRLAAILHINDLLSLLPPMCTQVILVPHRLLHVVPLHALPIEAEPGQYLIDRFTRGVRYVPSCQLLHHVQRQPPTDFQRLFAVQNPTGDLAYAALEVDHIRPHFASEEAVVLTGQDATTTCLAHPPVADQLRQAQCVHFACHGVFRVEAPLQSALHLADGVLPLADIFHLDLQHTRLVTLSACETAWTDLDSRSDEYLGLPGGFLYAGSRGVVSSLWAVSDVSTALLMIKLYETLQPQRRLQPGMVAMALKTAQHWLRNLSDDEFENVYDDLRGVRDRTANNDALPVTLRGYGQDRKPFAHPYYWAAFTATGL
jgi:CHAT domain-containing protein